MTRKRCHRKIWVPPPALRPKLSPSDVRTISVVHLQVLEDITQGRGNLQTLRDLVGAAFTWSHVAEMLGVGEAEMDQQVAMVTRVLKRYMRTRRVGFDGRDYQEAKLGCDVMDALAARVDRATAVAAANWSEAHCAPLFETIEQQEAA